MQHSYIIILCSGTPTSNRYNSARVFHSLRLVVETDRPGDKVASSNPSSEVETIFHLYHGDVVIHPSDVVVFVAVKNVIYAESFLVSSPKKNFFILFLKWLKRSTEL